MRIEALQAITIRLPGGELRDLRPGEPVTLPTELARKLLAKAPGKVKMVSLGQPCLIPGTWIEWDSPLFGRLTGELLAVCADGQVEVFHPLTETVAKIPQAWLRGPLK